MVKMVDISAKPEVARAATASGFIRLRPETLKKIKDGKLPKGDVMAVAKTAAVVAVKKTPELIPLTHPIPITGVDVELKLEKGGVRATVEVKSTGKTGVEMEALAGVSAALLTVWDMTKGMEKDKSGQYPTTVIDGIKVLRKLKG
ncbi:MAG: cyclic pyranopterin monophosphate synthase MoaC [Candidatus Hadarchaeota archaeon]